MACIPPNERVISITFHNRGTSIHHHFGPAQCISVHDQLKFRHLLCAAVKLQYQSPATGDDFAHHGCM